MKKLGKHCPDDRGEAIIFELIQDRDGVHIVIKGEKADLARMLAHAAQSSDNIQEILLRAQVLVGLWDSYERRKPVPIDGE